MHPGRRDVPTSDDSYSEEEAARRRDEALKRALNTPPKPHKAEGSKRGRVKKKGDAR